MFSRDLHTVLISSLGLLGLVSLTGSSHTVSALAAAEPAASPAVASPSVDPQHIKFFEEQVKPILKAKCFQCHGAQAKIRGGLRLNSRAGMLKGGDTGPAISLKEPEKSLLLEAINYESFEMPPQGKLPAEQIAILTRWVKLGSPWTPGDEPEPVAEKEHGPPPVNEKNKSFWSFQPIKRPATPAVKNKAWVKTDIDAFILNKLEAAGLSPVGPARKTQLLRRAYYDLTGLPPEPADVQEFLADESPQAFEKVVDRLLDSPHYGEKWGRHWLDLVRYAETNSYERDGAKPFVWRYRDYVIRSFNQDKPYDQFVIEQLAGDELAEPTAESIIATGYYRLGIWDDEPSDPEQAVFDDLDDVLSTTGQVFLGLTIGCARCHDHKLDPIPQRDYYSMLAFFRNVRRYGVRSHESVVEASLQVIAGEQERRKFAKEVEAHQRKLAGIQQRLEAIEKLVREDFVGVEKDEFQNERARLGIVKKRVPKLLTSEQFEDYAQLTRQRNRLRKSPPAGLAQALCVKEHGPQAPTSHVLIRGNAHAPGDVVEPGFLSVVTDARAKIESSTEAKTSRRRIALARWIANGENPLTARVIVNRIWQYHFGRGIVASTSNFGLQGDAPTHPELLDWLAAEFLDGGWKFKPLHKQIMLSNAYQMASSGDAKALAQDPENQLFWRFNLRRLTAEEIRDSLLAVNGSLNRDKMFGPSIYTVIPKEVLAGQSRPGAGWGVSSPEDRARRSIYIHVKRSLLTPILESFDVADADSTCPVRFATTQPTQALGMLNSEFLNEQARVFSTFLKQNAGSETSAQVKLGLQRTLQREPTPEEIDRGLALIEKLQREHNVLLDEALKHYCIVLLNLNEFVYLD